MSLVIFDGRYLAADRVAHEEQGITYDICKLKAHEPMFADPDKPIAVFVGGTGGVPHMYRAMEQCVNGGLPDQEYVCDDNGETIVRIARVSVYKRRSGEFRAVADEPTSLGTFPHHIRGLNGAIVLGLESCIIAARCLLSTGMNAMEVIRAISQHNPVIGSDVDYFDTYIPSACIPNSWTP